MLCVLAAKYVVCSGIPAPHAVNAYGILKTDNEGLRI